MKFILPCSDHDYKLGLESGTINGGTVWLNNIAEALKALGHKAKLGELETEHEADIMIIQSEWVGSIAYQTFKGKRVVLMGHFIKAVYPDPKEIKAKKFTTWKGECTEGFDAEFLPHAYSEFIDKKEATYKGDIIWCGNPYSLRNQGWLDGLDLTAITGTLPWDVSAIYKGNVCPNIHGDFQRGIVGNDPARVADKPGYMINERFWQVIGCGGILIQDWNPQVYEFFNEDEIIMCRTKEDFQEKIKYYAKHKEEGIKFYERAREKILNNHTYKNRCQQLLQSL
jgi:fructose-specific component phosphotransferase system IIB-like protein